MPKYLLYFITFTCWAIAAQAQPKTVFKRLHGTKVKTNIFLRWNEPVGKTPGRFVFRVDKDDTTDWSPVSEETLFNISNDRNNTISIFLKFFNPLRSSIQSTITEIDDPVYTAINEWLAHLPVAEAAPAANKTVTEKENAVFAAAPPPASFSTLETIIIYEWVNEFLSKVNPAVFTAAGAAPAGTPAAVAAAAATANQEKYKALVKAISNYAKDIDQYLFEHITINGRSMGFATWIAQQQQKLFNCPSDYYKFCDTIAEAAAVAGGLTSAKTRAENAIPALQSLLTDKYDTDIKPFINDAQKQDFRAYSKGASFWITLNTSDRMKLREENLQKFQAAVNKLTAFKDEFAGSKTGYRLEDAPAFSWSYTKMKQFEYNISLLNKDGAVVEKEKHLFSFIVAKDQRIVPFVSMGVFYTDFSYPNYAIEEKGGVKTVVETEETKVRVRPAAYLNFLIKTKGDLFYPFFQVGISTGVNDVLFPVGIGTSIRDKFSISLGPIFGQRKELTKLKPGATVPDDAALQNDLGKKGFLSWYFSVNYNL